MLGNILSIIKMLMLLLSSVHSVMQMHNSMQGYGITADIFKIVDVQYWLCSERCFTLHVDNFAHSKITYLPAGSVCS